MTDDVDVELVAAATAAVTSAYRPGWHFVGAALRTTSGAIHAGVNLQAYVTRISVCAEPIALGQAVLAGDGRIARSVAVFAPESGPPVVCSPCGMCRELIGDYGPMAEVIVPGDHGPTTVPIAELLPNKYTREPT
jgi:cytidine deaminase